ncbi:MAG: Nif3-like dinuclear metal center hexameric protein [Clostridiales bacterium]|nr:Nif3-like dinuclear metal center hexameric protein [Clostridiales bacterium]
MAKVKEVLDVMKKIAPEQFAYNKEYDNVGLIVGDPESEVNRVLCCLDVTEDIIEEAISVGAGLIISHHPMIFRPIKSVTTLDVQGRKIFRAIQKGIAIYAAHTNLDFVRDGINEFVANELALMDIRPLEPYISDSEGFGRVGNLSGSMFASVLKAKVKALLKDDYVRIIGEPDSEVNRIAVINGAGGGDTSYIDMAIDAGADCLITADVKHHVAVYAREMKLTVIEPQHFTMEYVYISRLVQILKIETLAGKIKLDIVQSKREVNPRS